MEISHRFVDVRSVKVHYLMAGRGDKTVVLLHGGGLDTAELSWELLIPDLTDNFRVIALDWPGYGQSDKPDVKFTIAYYIELFDQFLRILGVSKASLAGISMGGAIAIGYSLEHPEVVEDLILVDSYGLQRKVPMQFLSYLYVRTPGVRRMTYWLLKQRAFVKYSMASILKRPGSVTEELVDQIHQQVMIPGVAKAFSDLQDNDVSWNGLKTVFLEQLPNIRANTLIIHGEKDTLVPLDCSREAHQLISGSSLYIMEGCGHWPQRDNPEEFNRVVGAFLRHESQK